jgi:hypothetical protein
VASAQRRARTSDFPHTPSFQYSIIPRFQLRSRRPGRRGLIVRNKANLPRSLKFEVSSVKSAKQSQFGPNRLEEALAAKAAGAAASGDKRAKQSQFAQSDVKGKYLAEKELW